MWGERSFTAICVIFLYLQGAAVSVKVENIKTFPSESIQSSVQSGDGVAISFCHHILLQTVHTKSKWAIIFWGKYNLCSPFRFYRLNYLHLQCFLNFWFTNSSAFGPARYSTRCMDFHGLVSVGSDALPSWFILGVRPTLFLILPSSSAIYWDIRWNCRRFGFFAIRASSSPHILWPLVDVTQIASMDPLIICSAPRLLLFLVRAPARQMQLSFLTDRCRLQSAYSLGALPAILRNLSQEPGAVHTLIFHIIHGPVALCMSACQSVCFLWS